jgi:hypothetical protein
MIPIELLRMLMTGTDSNVERAMPSEGNKFANADARNRGLGLYRDEQVDEREQAPPRSRSKFNRGWDRYSGIGHTADDMRGEDDSGVDEMTRGLNLMAILRQMERGYTPRQLREQASTPDEPMPDQYGQIPWRR